MQNVIFDYCKSIYDYFKSLRIYQEQKLISKPYQVKFFNFWQVEIPDMWFYRFVQSRGLLKNSDLTIAFFSVFGTRRVINWNKSDVKIFFTGENVQRFGSYSDHALDYRMIDLSLGFEYLNDSRYLRFPLWLTDMFEPESSEEEIRKRCAELSKTDFGERNGFAALISNGDESGLRRNMCESTSTVREVNCAGSFMHNDDSLWQEYKNNKADYLKNYRFNICPENTNTNGYVTEKIFQAIASGCIPVYWGSNNNPEPEVLNHDAILFWQFDGNNSSVLDFINRKCIFKPCF